MKSENSAFLAIALIALLVGNGSAATVTIEASINTNSVIRDDITRATFGSGVDFTNPQFRWLMDTGPYANGPQTPAQQKIKGFNLGSMRFPNGDGAQLYQWDDPQHSYPFSNPNDPWAKWLTQEEMLKYTSPSANFADGLNMERLFQVNSNQYIDYNNQWTLTYVDQNFGQSVPPVINPTSLEKVSTRAADWVANNNGKPAHEKVNYWEVGNEDWIYWTGAQYGQIFNKFKDKMLAKRSNIKLLAQGLSQNFTTPQNGVNTMNSWIDGMKANITNPASSVYAYSDHEYLNAGEYNSDALELRRTKQTQEMLAQVDSGARINALKTKLASSSQTSPWKIWVTEFNLGQTQNGNLVELQDMGHALVIADWTGKMLSQNVERMFYHSLDHHNAYTPIQYVNSGGTIQDPRVTPPGYAYSIYAQEFGKTMLNNTVGTTTYPNPTLTAPNNATYKQLAVYSSIRPDAVNGDSLRVIVINRSKTDIVMLNLKTTGTRRMVNAPSKYTYRQLRSANLSDSNKTTTDAVKWTDPLQYNSSEWGIIGAALGPASVNYFNIPLQPVTTTNATTASARTVASSKVQGLSRLF